jgi:ABC-2 type transport system ATP-binding protein
VNKAIEMVGLTKTFGELTAVNSLDLHIDAGTIFGFIGPNGAGKSTTIRMLIDAIRPSHGSARILGLDCHTDMVQVHAHIGYLPAEIHLPEDLDGTGYLDYLGALRGLASQDHRAELIERFDLDPTRKLRELSTGNRRKIALVQAFMHRPDVVLLDEPTSGIDPLIQHEFHTFLADYAANGGTAFLSSHTLSEVERVADRVGIIRAGQLVMVDSIEALQAQARRRVEIDFVSVNDIDQLAADMVSIDGVQGVEVRPNGIDVIHSGDVDALLRAATAAGTIASIRAAAINLEEVFLNYYEAPDQ